MNLQSYKWVKSIKYHIWEQSHNFLVMADSHRIYEILSPLWQTIELTKELTDKIISNVNDFWHEKESFFEFKDVLITPENQELLKKVVEKKNKSKLEILYSEITLLYKEIKIQYDNIANNSQNLKEFVDKYNLLSILASTPEKLDDIVLWFIDDCEIIDDEFKILKEKLNFLKEKLNNFNQLLKYQKDFFIKNTYFYTNSNWKEIIVIIDKDGDFYHWFEKDSPEKKLNYCQINQIKLKLQTDFYRFTPVVNNSKNKSLQMEWLKSKINSNSKYSINFKQWICEFEYKNKKWDKFDVVIENWTVKNCFDSYWNSASKKQIFHIQKAIDNNNTKRFSKINIKKIKSDFEYLTDIYKTIKPYEESLIDNWLDLNKKYNFACKLIINLFSKLPEKITNSNWIYINWWNEMDIKKLLLLVMKFCRDDSKKDTNETQLRHEINVILTNINDIFKNFKNFN